MALTILSRLGADEPAHVISDSGHHVLLDRPLTRVERLMTLLADWTPR